MASLQPAGGTMRDFILLPPKVSCQCLPLAELNQKPEVKAA